MSIKTLIKGLITENDGTSICPIRLFAAIISVPAIIFFIVDGVIQIYTGHIDMQGMSTAFATLTAGYASLGVSVALKMKNETQ
jgi:hypothetical protein